MASRLATILVFVIVGATLIAGLMAADTNTPLRRAQVRINGPQPGLQLTANTDEIGRAHV